MPDFRDLLARTKAEIREVETDEAVDRPGVVFLDVREPEEYEQGALPGAVHIPRGLLESKIENAVPDRSAPIVVYCASGTRSALAARTLAGFGYREVLSMAGGFDKWKDEGRPWRVPQVLSAEQRNRYHRHLLLPEVAEAGQQKLLGAKALILGAGALGSPVALYLAAAGVGTIGVVDAGVVDEADLQRQVLHDHYRVGERKVDSAKKALVALNPDVNVVTYDVRFSAANALELMSSYEVVVDSMDRFASSYLVNDASLATGIPVVHASISGFTGRASVFVPYEGPCYRCLVRRPSAAELESHGPGSGALGVLPGVVGSIQAMEAIKLLLGLGDPLVGRLLTYDALEETFRVTDVARIPDCPACGRAPGEIVITDYDELMLAEVSVTGG